MIDEALFKEFLDNRAQVSRKGVAINTKRAILMLRNKLTEFENEGHNLDNIMNKAIEMGWTSVFRLKDEEPKQQHLTAPKVITMATQKLVSSTRIPKSNYKEKHDHANQVRQAGLDALANLKRLTGSKK